MLQKRIHTRNNSRRSAFTLLELLLVLAILVVMGGMAVTLYTGIFAKAKNDTAKADIKLIKDHIRNYHMGIGTLPSTLDDLVNMPGDLADQSKWAGPYLEKTPKDPWDHDYIYEIQDSSLGTFSLTSAGADGAPNTGDDVRP